jgi:hypothetical protein
MSASQYCRIPAKKPMSFRSPPILAALLFAALPSLQANDFDMSGYIGYNRVGGVIALNVERIDNYQPLGS